MSSEVFLESHHSDEITALMAVASEGSFVGAGRRLQRDPSVISKRVAAMEARLGIRLIERSTRQLRMTQVGLQLVERLKLALTSVAEAQQEAKQGSIEVRGVLRLALPAAMGRLWLAPILPEFLQANPGLSIVADYSDRFVDIIAEGYDAAIRVGELGDNRLVAKKLWEHRRILCASPEYLKQYGEPRTPDDLTKHNCLRFSGLASFPEWRLFKKEVQQKVSVKGALTSNDGEALLAAARAGVGILGAGEWLMSRDREAGLLKRVLTDWHLDGDEGGVYIVSPSSRFVPASTQAFKDWIEGKFACGAPWLPPTD
ncbi:LysR family transcriptional regulator [Pseudomonas syringae]|uniref:Transcriptional regulator, LysR family n=1 Tax=Pseudomonas syringae TaxID=317 RepID=A0AB37ZLD4_PSESX|nr:LysR family transcriptional regulator [Pseudomonas syringae]MBI6669083.1 LysR family transcriptional regulator [Pseudomonas syringae]MBI6676642.1 LysR family transcriptional regulator [Pseudomonas syringae]MBI6839921.1 LysR family transcriptional regulator [Pseudomonas syringae]NAP21447.1 LysR family transcriptional regulator [Pseudomonas syringae]NAQ15735.1 LysR family transcriptional regulator [Pseudomonas syringae]